MSRTYYCYNRSNNKLTNHTLINPNTKLVRNQFGLAEAEYTEDNMRPEFFFKSGIIEVETPEEIDFLNHLVSGKQYKLKNGRMFDTISLFCTFKAEQVQEENTKTTTVVKNVDKLVIMEESAKLMSIDAFNNFFVKVGLPLPTEQKTKVELIEILRENGHVI